MLVENTWETHGIYMKYEGVVHTHEMLSSSNNYGKAQFENIKYILIDLSSVTDTTIEASDLTIKAFQSNAAKVWNKSLQLIFVISNDPMKSIIQIYMDEMTKLGSPWKIEMADSLQEARELVTL